MVLEVLGVLVLLVLTPGLLLLLGPGLVVLLVLALEMLLLELTLVLVPVLMVLVMVISMNTIQWHIIIFHIQSTPLNRVTSVRAYFDPIKRRILLTENIFVLASMCESYSGPAKSDPIKLLTRLNSDPIKRSRLYKYVL